jgi:hypothetical protein
MRNILKFPVIIAIILIGIEAQIFASDLSELKPYLKKTVSWKCTILDRNVPLNIYFSEGEVGPEGSDVIVYMKNSAWERIGQESDFSILSDYIQKKFIVITVDFGNDKQAVSPHFDMDLLEIFRAVYGYKTESLFKGLNLATKGFRCFFLPEGYRVATDLVYWEIDKHAVYGTMEYIMQSYNEDIVPKFPGMKSVSSPMEMVDRYGNPLDFTVKMDIIYPSQTKKKLPAIFNSEVIGSIYPTGMPRSYLPQPHMAGFALRGYVCINIGHCFNPCVQHFFHFGKFTLDAWNGLACYTAAIRFLNVNSEIYRINTDYIGGIGISKGQYAITRLSDPNNASGKEISKFEGFPEGTPKPQPWPGYPSKIAAGWQGMGMGLFEPGYITADYVPNIVACGENDREVITKDGHPKFVARLEELDANYINLFMQGLEHEISYGYDERLGVDRYQLMIDFFDRYLKPKENLSPVVLIVSPHDNKNDVAPDSEISIDFAPVIDSRTILQDKGIVVMQTKNNQEVKGSWKAAHRGSRFTFKPDKAFSKGEQYSIHITTKVKDESGVKLDQEKITQFKIVAE